MTPYKKVALGQVLAEGKIAYAIKGAVLRIGKSNPLPHLQIIPLPGLVPRFAHADLQLHLPVHRFRNQPLLQQPIVEIMQPHLLYRIPA